MKQRIATLPAGLFRARLLRYKRHDLRREQKRVLRDLMKGSLNRLSPLLLPQIPPGEPDWERWNAEMEQQRAEKNRIILESKTDWIADRAWLCWQKDDLRFFLHESPAWLEFRKIGQEMPGVLRRSTLEMWGRFNGYVRFPKLPMVAPGLGGILTYVPVHGGLTYFQEWWDGSVTYGFDTGHAWSDPKVMDDLGWMMEESEAMARGIQIAARFEPYYLNARTEEQKHRVLERMQAFTPVTVNENFGVMVNLLTGEL